MIDAMFPSPETTTRLIFLGLEATLILGIAWLATALLRRASAAARHLIWALGVVGALLLPVLSALAPRLAVWESSPGAPTLGARLSPLQVAPDAVAEASWLPGLLLLWAAGTLLVGLRVLRGHLAARRLWTAARPVVSEAWASAQHLAASTLGVSRNIELKQSASVASPMTLGLLRPRVLLPAQTEGWSPERREAVLTHELGHVRRRDTLVQLGAQLACALYWWSPLAWLAASRLRVEREHACDDLVLRAGFRPSSYAADLLEVARRVSRAAPAQAVCMADPSGVEARLRRVLDPSAPRQLPSARVRGAAVVATLGLVGALAASATPPAPTPPAPTSALRLGTPWVQELAVEGQTPPPALMEARPLDLLEVQAELRRHMGDLERCYDRRRQARPGLSGQVVIHWSILENGQVGEQCITEDGVGDPELLDCVNALIRASRFLPVSDGPVDITLPFLFGQPA